MGFKFYPTNDIYSVHFIKTSLIKTWSSNEKNKDGKTSKSKI